MGKTHKRLEQEKKEALITGKWDQLRIEAECKNETSHKNLTKARPLLDSARIDQPKV
jgi:hypothetical protein